jgi:hypothetical protein
MISLCSLKVQIRYPSNRIIRTKQPVAAYLILDVLALNDCRNVGSLGILIRNCNLSRIQTFRLVATRNAADAGCRNVLTQAKRAYPYWR